MPRNRLRLRKLRDELVRIHPMIDDPDAAISDGEVLVDGHVVSNPATLVREGTSIAFRTAEQLRGEPKLAAALEKFEINVSGRVALDVGAAAGGFTRVLLRAGATRVYAVDAGHGQLLGSLRQDPRVVNLERTNLGDLTPDLVPDAVELFTLDLSYLALSAAVPQLECVRFAELTEAVALVKPQFELGLPSPPTERFALDEAVARAKAGFEASGWSIRGEVESPVRGARGSTEFLVHAVRERPRATSV